MPYSDLEPRLKLNLLSPPPWLFFIACAATGLLYLINAQLQRQLLFGAWQSLIATTMIYTLVNGLLLVGYVYVIALCRRGHFEQGSGPLIVLGAPLIFCVVLQGSAPSLSPDVYSYLAHGYLGIAPGHNPLLERADTVAGLPIGAALRGLGWHTPVLVTPYGILWTRIEILVMRLSGADVITAMHLMKAIMLLAHVGCVASIWWIAASLAPSSRLLATAIYAWNPLAVVEIAGDGHNDAAMVLFALLALGFSITRRPAASLLAAALGVLTKYVPLMFVPAQWVYFWRTRYDRRRLVIESVVGLAIAVAIAALLYGSLWSGKASFSGILNRGDPTSSASPLGLINWALRRSPLAAHAAPLTLLLIAVPAGIAAAWSILTAGTAARLGRAFIVLSLTYTLGASPDYWPWYACMPIALVAAVLPSRLWWLILLMTAAGRLCAPLDLLYLRGVIGFVLAKGLATALGTTLPLLAVFAWGLRSRLGRPTAPTLAKF